MLTSSNLPQIMEGIHAQIAVANLAISRVENDLKSVQTGIQQRRLGRQPRALETTE
jgi:hypothetical protein